MENATFYWKLFFSPQPFTSIYILHKFIDKSFVVKLNLKSLFRHLHSYWKSFFYFLKQQFYLDSIFNTFAESNNCHDCLF